jgi:translation initiation factor IF-3
MRRLIAKLLSEGKKKEEIIKIIAIHLKSKIKANDVDTNVKNLFSTIAVSIKSAGEAYDVGDVAHLNFTLNTVTSIKKTISELEKVLTEIKTANETPGGEAPTAIEEPKKDLILKPATEVKPEVKSEIKKSEEVK